MWFSTLEIIMPWPFWVVAFGLFIAALTFLVYDALWGKRH